MADPKFENLPGITYDQPDVYETPDNPEQETSDYYEEELENESIERLHISTRDSFNHFRDSTLEGNVDFSDKIGRRMRKGYDVRSGEYELLGIGEKESPVQKCRRLQYEINELMEDITSLQSDRKLAENERKSYNAVSAVMGSARKVLESLRLEQVLGNDQHANSTNKEIIALFHQVEEYKSSGVLTAIQPSHADLASSARIAKLEYRLHQIEQSLGSQPEKLSRLTSLANTLNIMETVRELSTKAALMQPEQLDHIETRLATLVAKMDTIAEKSCESMDNADRDQKINELYDLAKKTESVCEILPEIIERMQALESLHKYAMNFAKIIADIEEKQTSITTTLVCNKELLHSAQEGFSQNMEIITKEVNKVEQRLNSVLQKKK